MFPLGFDPGPVVLHLRICVTPQTRARFYASGVLSFGENSSWRFRRFPPENASAARGYRAQRSWAIFSPAYLGLSRNARAFRAFPARLVGAELAESSDLGAMIVRTTDTHDAFECATLLGVTGGVCRSEEFGQRAAIRGVRKRQPDGLDCRGSGVSMPWSHNISSLGRCRGRRSSESADYRGVTIRAKVCQDALTFCT